MKDIKESIAVIESLIECKWLDLRDLDKEEAEEFNNHWESITVVPRLEKDFCIKSADQRDNYLSMIEGMQEVILDDQSFRTEYVKYQSLCVIQYLLENIKCYPFVLNVNNDIYEWLEEIKIQVEESELDNLNDMRIDDIYDQINWNIVSKDLYIRFVEGNYESDDKEDLIKILMKQNNGEK